MLSARNQILGTVQEVTSDGVECAIKVAFNKYVATAVVTAEAAQSNVIKAGQQVALVFKAPHVLFANSSEPLKELSARNQFAGTISRIEPGAVNAQISLTLEGGATITGSITEQALEELGFEVGSSALAIIKATDIMLSVV